MNRNLWKWGKKALRVISFPLRLLFSFLSWIIRKLVSALKQARTGILIVTFFLVLAFALLIVGYFVPVKYVFEGNLIVKQMSFTYAGQLDKLFLNNLSGIRNLDIEGSQPQPLTLNGKFSSSDPNLDRQLSKLNKLTIELPYPTSRLIFTPTQPSELSILELRINPKIKVQQLAYNFLSHQLSFCLESNTNHCLSPEDLARNPAQSNSEKVSTIKLQLGQQPLTVSLGSVNIPELDIKPSYLTFQFIPTIDDANLTLSSPSRLFINLPKSTENAQEKIANSSQWFWGDIDVNNVNFYRFKTTDKVTDELKTSTIVRGEVRMGSEVMKLKENQFLIVRGKPGIKKLAYLKINTESSKESPPGLQTYISGESTAIEVGLYPEFPVQSIKPKWIAKISPEAVNALVAGLVAAITVLLDRLFPEPPQP